MDEKTRLQAVDKAARDFLTTWNADEWVRLNAKGALREAVEQLNNLASKPGREAFRCIHSSGCLYTTACNDAGHCTSTTHSAEGVAK